MQRLTIAIVGAVLFSLTASSVYAQSGSRGPIRRGPSPAERAAAQRAQTSLQNSQASSLRAKAQNNYQSARKAYIDAQATKQNQRIKHRAEQKRITAELRERNIQKRNEREIEQAMRIANSSIDWPVVLQKQRYDKYRAEIEALAKLYLALKENTGVKVGFNASVRRFAQQIVRDEYAGVFNESHSREVRTFVRALNSNYGQFPEMMKQKTMDGEMLVSKM
jgi:hypothetical protein